MILRSKSLKNSIYELVLRVKSQNYLKIRKIIEFKMEMCFEKIKNSESMYKKKIDNFISL